MNKRNLQQWELRLGLAQLVILLGIVTGSMACAFYIGFSSGRAVGFESALERSLANVARIPIAAEGAAPREDSTTEVYAKLSQPVVSDSELKREAEKPSEIPLGAIKSADAAPVSQDLPPVAAKREGSSLLPDSKSVSVKPESLGTTLEREVAANRIEESSSTNGRGLGGSSEQPIIPGAKNPSAKTLGALIAEKTARVEAAPLKTEPVAKTEIAKAAPVKQAEVIKKEKPSEVAPPAKEQRPSSLIRERIPAGWFAQIAAPRKIQDANSLASRLKASGFPVMIEVAKVRGDEYYRVLVGPEQGRAQADRLVGQLKRESYIQGDPFLRVVK